MKARLDGCREFVDLLFTGTSVESDQKVRRSQRQNVGVNVWRSDVRTGPWRMLTRVRVVRATDRAIPDSTGCGSLRVTSSQRLSIIVPLMIKEIHTHTADVQSSSGFGLDLIRLV